MDTARAEQDLNMQDTLIQTFLCKLVRSSALPFPIGLFRTLLCVVLVHRMALLSTHAVLCAWCVRWHFLSR